MYKNNGMDLLMPYVSDTVNYGEKPASSRLDSKILKYVLVGIKKGAFKAKKGSMIRSFQSRTQKVGWVS